MIVPTAAPDTTADQRGFDLLLTTALQKSGGRFQSPRLLLYHTDIRST